jgi:hypothetical protein
MTGFDKTGKPTFFGGHKAYQNILGENVPPIPARSAWIASRVMGNQSTPIFVCHCGLRSEGRQQVKHWLLGDRMILGC